MEKFSYNSYPDSAESSPRSRDVDFDNPPPWEDQQQQQQQQQQTHTYKVKFMCSYGGKIQPRPHDNQLTYVNGDTKILSVDRGIRFPALASKLSAVIGGAGDVGGGGGEIVFKYQLPGEDLDALISVTNEDDLEHMMHEYDRLLRMSSKPARMRLFLFPAFSQVSGGGFGSEGSTKSDRETLSTIPNRAESEKSGTAPVSSNADFLFGSEKVVSAPAPLAETVPQQIQDPQMFLNQQVVTPEQGVNPAEIQRQIHELQRIQIRDQEQMQQQLQQQQQEAMYRRKSEEGRYFTPQYAQNPPPPPAPTTVSQANTQPPVGYWQGNNNNIYTTTSQNLPEQQVYMIPAQSQAQPQPQAPGTVYHSVMRPPPTQNQGYYPPVQRVQQHHPDPYMEQQNSQQGYNVVQPPQPTYSGGPQVMSSGPMGLHETPPYSQMGNPVYYTVAGDGSMMVPPQPHQTQYQGMGQPVSGMTGPDGKVVVNTAPKGSQSSDSV